MRCYTVDNNGSLTSHIKVTPIPNSHALYVACGQSVPNSGGVSSMLLISPKAGVDADGWIHEADVEIVFGDSLPNVFALGKVRKGEAGGHGVIVLIESSLQNPPPGLDRRDVELLALGLDPEKSEKCEPGAIRTVVFVPNGVSGRLYRHGGLADDYVVLSVENGVATVESARVEEDQ